MGKKLTEQQKEDRVVRDILSKIKKLEKVYPQYLVERACHRYTNANRDKRKAKKELTELQNKVKDAERRLR